MKVPSFEEAIIAKDIFNYEVHRNVLGWQLSYTGENIATFITNEEAAQLIKRMDDRDIEEQAYEVD
jgi:hypothetical protein